MTTRTLPQPTADAAAIEQAATSKAILRRVAAGRSYAARDFQFGIWNGTIEVQVAIAAISAALRSRSDLRNEALEDAARVAETRIGRAKYARGAMGQMFADTQDQEATDIAAAILALKATPITTDGVEG